MISLRQPGRSPLVRAVARVLILALGATLTPLDLSASIPAGTSKLTKSAFGELLAHSGTDPQPYAFTGEPLDPNSGFQYHRARWMDPSVGRFTGMDPWGGDSREPVTLHAYQYAASDPGNRSDPTGEFVTGPLVVAGFVTAISATAVIAIATVMFATGLAAATASAPSAGSTSADPRPPEAEVLRVVALRNKSGRVDIDEWELREGQQGLSVFEKVAYPLPSMVIAAVRARGKKGKGGVGALVLRREDVWALGLRFIRTLGETGVPPVDAVHFDIRLSLFREIGFSFRAEAKRLYFNSVISPQLQAAARPLLE